MGLRKSLNNIKLRDLVGAPVFWGHHLLGDVSPPPTLYIIESGPATIEKR
jgi:hypothetical protein